MKCSHCKTGEWGPVDEHDNLVPFTPGLDGAPPLADGADAWRCSSCGLSIFAGKRDGSGEMNLCPRDGGELAFDPNKTGETCGGLALKGWLVCAVCGSAWLSKRAQAEFVGDEWELAKGGRSLNCGGVRIRAEGKAQNPGALMARIQRLPLLEAVLADPLVDTALAYLTSSHADYDEGERAACIAELRKRLAEVRAALDEQAPEAA